MESKQYSEKSNEGSKREEGEGRRGKGDGVGSEGIKKEEETGSERSGRGEETIRAS